VGQNFGADSLHSRFNKYLVGVIDEKAKTIRLHDAQAFSLKQVGWAVLHGMAWHGN
jgi:hypothetical protein